jgi:hypothetical protein
MKKMMIPAKDRPSRPVTIRMPVDLIEDLKRVAPTKGMSGYQSLIKYYVGQGLRDDLELLRHEARMEKLEIALDEMGLASEQKSRIRELLEGSAETTL